MAWGQLEFRHLGRLSRRAAEHRTHDFGPSPTEEVDSRAARVGTLPAGVGGLGILPGARAPDGILRPRPDGFEPPRPIASDAMAVAPGVCNAADRSGRRILAVNFPACFFTRLDTHSGGRGSA